MNKIEQKIIRTLAYSAQFNHPLTETELFRFLETDSPVSLDDLINTLSKLIKNSTVFESDGYYSLERSVVAQAKVRQKTQIISQKLLTSHHQLLKGMLKLPTIQAVFISGSVAVGAAMDSDDIDVVIIAKSGMLWLSRIMVTVYLELARVRRRPYSDNPSGLICANLYLESGCLLIPKNLHNLYTARELAQLVPLLDPQNEYAQLLAQNAWLKKFLANISIPPIKPPTHSIALAVTYPFEVVAFFCQFLYMSPRRTREKISLHYAFFHPKNTAETILNRYRQKLEEKHLLESTV